MKKRAQTAVEFIILISFVLLVFTMFFLLIQSNLSDNKKYMSTREVKELALTVQEEINLASDSVDGYYREFKIPLVAGNEDYDINLTEGFVYIRTKSGRNSIALPVRVVEGNILKGDNFIKKQNGGVKLNVV